MADLKYYCFKFSFFKVFSLSFSLLYVEHDTIYISTIVHFLSLKFACMKKVLFIPV